MRLDRQQQLWALIGLTALTMAPQYAMQGWLATGGNFEGLGTWFPRLDAVAWAIRAIIEAWALIYLFSTPAKDKQQAIALGVFEVALITLIIVTLGPALAAAGSNESMKVYLGSWYGAWNFAVASYAPLMLGAAGFAFKIENQAVVPATVKAIAPVNQTVNQAIIQPVNAPKPKRKRAAKPADSTTKDKALEVLKDDPQISGSHLGRVVGVSASRGRQLKAELEALVPALNGNGNGSH